MKKEKEERILYREKARNGNEKACRIDRDKMKWKQIIIDDDETDSLRWWWIEDCWRCQKQTTVKGCESVFVYMLLLIIKELRIVAEYRYS